MTTDKEALQKIFEAALKQPDPPPTARPKPATPTMRRANYGEAAMAITETPTRQITKPASKETATPASPKEQKPITREDETARKPAETPQAGKQAVLDDKASDELAKVLEKKMAWEKTKHKIQKVATIIVLLGAVGGGIGWFVSSPDRVKSLSASVEEIQSAGDVNGMVDSYKGSLDKVAGRGNELSAATAALGASTELKEGEDAYMEDEMNKMSGGEGKSVGSRAKAMQKTFGDRAKDK